MAWQSAAARVMAEYQLHGLLNSGEGSGKMSLTKTSYNYMALRRFAHECASHKAYGTCNNMCQNCALNISAYSIPREEAVIIQQMAELDVGQTLARQRQVLAEQRAETSAERKNVRLLVWVILIGIGVSPFIQLRSCRAETNNDRITQREAPVVAAIEPPVRKQAPADPLAPIRSTLNQVTKQRDMNGDGKVTCVDYTLMFYDAYPNKNNVRVVWNKNNTANLNHLFVKVWVNGQWMPVEPQAYVHPVTDRWFSMRKYWGTKYSPNYDLDVTPNIEKIRQRTFVWSFTK
jgi:hypothetical protein